MLSKGSTTKSRGRGTRMAASCDCRRDLRLRISSLEPRPISSLEPRPRAAGGAGSCVELVVALVPHLAFALDLI